MAAGEQSSAAIGSRIRNHLQQAGVDEVQYVAFLSEGTMREVELITSPTVVTLAARVGRTRLIDNHRLGEVANFCEE